MWNDKRIKILEAKLQITNNKSQTNLKPQISNYKQGKVFVDENKDLCLGFADGCWVVKTLQLEGEKAMSAKDFLNGHKDIVGSVLS